MAAIISISSINWISSKEIYEQKIELLGFFHLKGVILHAITKNSENVNKPGSYLSQWSFHQYESKYNSNNVDHATWKNYKALQDGNEYKSPSRYQ